MCGLVSLFSAYSREVRNYVTRHSTGHVARSSRFVKPVQLSCSEEGLGSFCPGSKRSERKDDNSPSCNTQILKIHTHHVYFGIKTNL